jgi:hypothetical protein
MAKIENVHLLEDIFGYFPSFHDAEVLRIVLDRKIEKGRLPTLEASIHVFEMTSEIVDGRYLLRNHTLVTFQFLEADEIHLEGFNQQNVLQELSIEDISDQQLEWLKFEVQFNGIFGMDLRFRCRGVRILSAEPFKH